MKRNATELGRIMIISLFTSLLELCGERSVSLDIYFWPENLQSA